jgi:hypothetical protein
MNLIQVQERLKDLPLQAIMAYANGINPDVPPYLALGEMQRRKRLEQEPSEPPTGTVKDQLEQQAGLAALQGMRMGQAQQQMMQGAAAQPMPVPEGAPQPDMQPEATGIANAAAQPGVMQPDVLKMAGGGIVAFAKGTKEAVDSSSDEDDEDDDEEEQGAESFPVEDRPIPQGRDIEELVPIGPTPLDRQPEFAPIGPTPLDRQPEFVPITPPTTRSLQPQATPQDPYDNRAARTPPTGTVNYGPIQAAQAPQGPQTTAQRLEGLLSLAAQARKAAPVAPEFATRESMAAQDPAMYGVLNKPIGVDYLAGLQALATKQGAQDEAARKQLEANKRMDFYKALVAAGEGTRGQRGGLGSLGGLGAGFTKSIAPSMEARAQEAAAIEAAPIKREELLNKAKYDIQELQRAQGNNDLKTVNAQRAKLFNTAVEAYKSGNAALAREITALAGLNGREVAAAAQLQAARIRAAAKGQGGNKAEKITDERQGVEDFYQARIARGEPPGPETRVKARQDYARTKGVASLESTAARRDPAIDAEVRKREMLNTDLWSKSEAEKQQWRDQERAKIVADIEAGRLRLMAAPGTSSPSPAPGPAPTTRLKFDAQGKLQQ